MSDTISQIIDKQSHVPLHRQVKEYLLAYIKMNSATNTIPPEMDITRQFGISRDTVRKAILDLVNDGVLIRIPGKGTFVRRNRDKLVFTNWYSSQPHSAAFLSQVLDQFRAARPDVNIEHLGIPYLQTEQQLMLMTSAGKAPDIATLVYLWLPIFAHQGALLPLDDLYTPQRISNLYPGTLDAIKIRGHCYALNWVNAPNILYINRGLLEEHSGNVRYDLDYFEGMVDAFARVWESSHGQIIPFSIPIYDDEFFLLCGIYHFLHAFRGGILDGRGEVVFNSSENIRAFTWLKDFIKRGHVDISQDHLASRSLFARNKLAMIIEGPWLAGLLPSLNPDYRSDAGTVEYLPTPKTPVGRSSSILWNHTLTIFQQCQDKELAKEFIQYLTDDPKAGELSYTMTKMLPTRLDELNTNPVYDDPLGRVLRRQMQDSIPIPFTNSPFFLLSISFCAKAAREIILGDQNIASTLNHYTTLLRELNKR
jgi:ABC-type glycerol-3-phosphate transport system substrate-binding protein